MTERQKRLLEELPKCNNILSKAAEKVGYSKYTSKSSIYGLVRNSKNLQRKSEEDVRGEFIHKIKRLQKRMAKASDNTNLMRAVEIEGKVLGVYNDKAQDNSNKVIVVNYKLRFDSEGKPIVPTQVELEQLAREQATPGSNETTAKV